MLIKQPEAVRLDQVADEILASIARFAQRTADARAALQISRTTITGH